FHRQTGNIYCGRPSTYRYRPAIRARKWHMTDYSELASLADRLLEIADDDERKLARILDTLESDVRLELLVSDFFNAYQVFYYFFREDPGELVKERLILNSASELPTGVLADEIDDLEIIFGVRGGTPLIHLSDGERVIARFTGPDAYHQARSYIEESELF
ncbi:MAG: hypothetical protein ACXQTG_03835, partial [Methanoculleaceae archaeon]